MSYITSIKTLGNVFGLQHKNIDCMSIKIDNTKGFYNFTIITTDADGMDYLFEIFDKCRTITELHFKYTKDITYSGKIRIEKFSYIQNTASNSRVGCEVLMNGDIDRFWTKKEKLKEEREKVMFT